MRTIWKHALQFTDGPQVVTAPANWRVLHVADQHGQPTLWLEVDTDALGQWARPFHVIGTGHPVPAGGTYVGSSHSGPFVWHVYETPAPTTAVTSVSGGPRAALPPVAPEHVREVRQ